MPFYLVTQTTLIEAEDEHAAAQKAVDQIRRGRQVTVAVKSDETNVSHIVVDAKSDETPPVQIADPHQGRHNETAQPDPPAAVRTDKKAVLQQITKDVLTLMKWRP